MEKTVRSKFVAMFAAIHPFWIAHEVACWLGVARRELWRCERSIAGPTSVAHNPPRKLGDYVMPGPYKEAARQLHAIAQFQQGFFTAKQAIRSLFSEKITDGSELAELSGHYIAWLV
jgi:hypothetical protein